MTLLPSIFFSSRMFREMLHHTAWVHARPLQISCRFCGKLEFNICSAFFTHYEIIQLRIILTTVYANITLCTAGRMVIACVARVAAHCCAGVSSARRPQPMSASRRGMTTTQCDADDAAHRLES